MCGHVLTVPGPSTSQQMMPTPIVSGFLYLGSYDTASRSEVLKTLGITHLLNVRGRAAPRRGAARAAAPASLTCRVAAAGPAC